jgi:hypothetical protein
MWPSSLALKGLALILALVALVGIVYLRDKSIRDDGAASCNASNAEAALEATRKQKADDDDKAKRTALELVEANKRAETYRIAAARATAANAGLQSDLASARSRIADPAATVASLREAATDATDLFGRCSGRYTMLGQSAQQAREAGELCARLYNANTPITDAVKALK